MTKWLAAILLALLVAGCATTPRPNPMLLQQQVATLKLRLFELIEAERMQAGAKPMTIDGTLAAGAQAHSEDMAKKRSFDTMNPDGNLGVNTVLSLDPLFVGFLAENSAAQYFNPSRAGIDPEAMAKGFLKIWLESPGHRNNLMNPAVERTGIGVAINGNEIYAAELFATNYSLERHD
jgi:uncharacterized protein YkwD